MIKIRKETEQRHSDYLMNRVGTDINLAKIKHYHDLTEDEKRILMFSHWVKTDEELRLSLLMDNLKILFKKGKITNDKLTFLEEYFLLIES